MNYFNPYPLCVDNAVTTAWQSQIAEAAKTPSLAELLAQRGGELFPIFVASYTELRALPRGARRALQRRLAHSRELSAVLQEWLQQQSSRALQQKLARTLAGAALLLALGQGPSDAATITVNTTVPGIAADTPEPPGQKVRAADASLLPPIGLMPRCANSQVSLTGGV